MKNVTLPLAILWFTGCAQLPPAVQPRDLNDDERGRYAQTIAELQGDKQKALADLEEARNEAYLLRVEAADQQEQAEQLRYINHIKSAQIQWQNQNPKSAENHLEQCEPKFRKWEYHYLHALFTRAHKTFDRKSRSVNVFPTDLAFSPDGRQILNADYGGRLNLSDAGTGQVLKTLKGFRAALSRDGSRIVSVIRNRPDPTLQLWDTGSGEMLLTFKGNPGYVSEVAFSPDGKLIVCAGSLSPSTNAPSLKLWDAATGEESLALSGHRSKVTAVAFSPDGTRLISASLDRTLKLWDVATGKELLTLTGHASYVLAVAFSPDAKRIVSGGPDGIKMWDAGTGVQETVSFKDAGSVTSLAFSSDGGKIASGGDQRPIQLWDASSGEQTQIFIGHNFDIQAVAFSPDGSQLASLAGKNYHGEFMLWDIGGTESAIEKEAGRVSAGAFSSDGRQIASGGWDNRLTLWDAASGARTRVISLRGAGGNLLLDLAYSPDGKWIVTGSRPNHRAEHPSPTVRVWHTGEGTEALALQGAFTGFTDDVAVSPDGRKIAAVSRKFGVHEEGAFGFSLWDTRTGAEVLKIPARSGPVVFSPDSTEITGSNGRLAIYDTRTGEQKVTLQSNSRLRCVAFSPVGSLLVSGAANGRLKLWDTTSGKETLTLGQHTEDVLAVAFSPDGSRIASSSADETIKVWDADTGEEMLTLKGHAGDSSIPLSFSPDGQRILSGGRDGISLR